MVDEQTTNVQAQDQAGVDGASGDAGKTRRMPKYHVELMDGSKQVFDTKGPFDKFIEDKPLSEICRAYVGHELPLKAKTVVVVAE